MDTIFPPHVGFSLRIDIGEGKGGEKGFLFRKEIPNQALWARSEVTSNFGRWKKKNWSRILVVCPERNLF